MDAFEEPSIKPSGPPLLLPTVTDPSIKDCMAFIYSDWESRLASMIFCRKVSSRANISSILALSGNF